MSAAPIRGPQEEISGAFVTFADVTELLDERGLGPHGQLAGLDAAAIHRFTDAAAAAGAILRLVRDGDLVLVKGSRGMKTEKVVEALVARGKE